MNATPPPLSSAEHAPPVLPAAMPSVAARLAKPIALVVDIGEPETGGLMARLHASGFSVQAAHSLTEAKQQSERRAPQVVMIALDMPDGDSLELLRHPPVAQAAEIILTGHADDPDRIRRGILNGASYFFCRRSTKHYLDVLLDDLARELASKAPQAEDALAHTAPIDQFGLLRGGSERMGRTVRPRKGQLQRCRQGAHGPV